MTHGILMAANCMTELHPTSARLESVEKEAVVARDGIEPPTPAFSGPPSNSLSGSESVEVVDVT